MVSSCKSLTYNIYTLFCIVQLHTQSQKHHIWKWIYLDFWGFVVQRAKNASAYIRHRRCFYTCKSNLTELSDYYSNFFALVWDYEPSEIINKDLNSNLSWMWFWAQFNQGLFASCVHRAVSLRWVSALINELVLSFTSQDIPKII